MPYFPLQWHHMSVKSSKITDNIGFFLPVWSGQLTSRKWQNDSLLALCTRNLPVTGGSPRKEQVLRKAFPCYKGEYINDGWMSVAKYQWRGKPFHGMTFAWPLTWPKCLRTSSIAASCFSMSFTSRGNTRTSSSFRLPLTGNYIKHKWKIYGLDESLYQHFTGDTL